MITEQAPAATTSVVHKPRTLIVEDDRVSRTALVKILEQMGHEMDTATTVAEGLSKLSLSPDCVLLDLMLPDGSGVALLERIRRDSLPIRVGVTTGTSDRDMLDAVKLLKPDALFLKPLHLPDIARWLARPE
ncbi:MAG: response regulator consisting of a CheY-like receiver domain and a Fis-type domain protein [Phycisphaerales bacterium]|nr:response regulator consisting of a CheY-like receiver domain and a Fis-type domain protein [Phycisphaerales bacterium]